MGNFDKRCKQIINEISLGSLASGAASFAGSALKAAENPGQGVQSAISGIKQRMQSQKQQALLPFSLKNPPKVGQIVVTTTPIYGLSNKETAKKVVDDAGNVSYTKSRDVVKLIPQATITAKVTSKIDNQGNYQVTITDNQGGPITNKYMFGKTKDEPYWRVFDATKMPYEEDMLEGDDGKPEEDFVITTGLKKEDVSSELKNWVDYKQSLKQEKK
jgi:hypothetical protein